MCRVTGVGAWETRLGVLRVVLLVEHGAIGAELRSLEGLVDTTASLCCSIGTLDVEALWGLKDLRGEGLADKPTGWGLMMRAMDLKGIALSFRQSSEVILPAPWSGCFPPVALRS